MEKLKENNNEKIHRPDFSEPVVFELRPPGQFNRRRERKIPSSKAAIWCWTNTVNRHFQVL
jgi:hypothetical protein